MEYIVCCLCSLLCFVCGVWQRAAQNCRVGNEKSRKMRRHAQLSMTR